MIQMSKTTYTTPRNKMKLGKPLGANYIQARRNLSERLNKFERAVINLSWIGIGEPEREIDIHNTYKRRKKSLRKALWNLLRKVYFKETYNGLAPKV